MTSLFGRKGCLDLLEYSDVLMFWCSDLRYGWYDHIRSQHPRMSTATASESWALEPRTPALLSHAIRHRSSNLASRTQRTERIPKGHASPRAASTRNPLEMINDRYDRKTNQEKKAPRIWRGIETWPELEESKWPNIGSMKSSNWFSTKVSRLLTALGAGMMPPQKTEHMGHIVTERRRRFLGHPSTNQVHGVHRSIQELCVRTISCRRPSTLPRSHLKVLQPLLWLSPSFSYNMFQNIAASTFYMHFSEVVLGCRLGQCHLHSFSSPPRPKHDPHAVTLTGDLCVRVQPKRRLQRQFTLKFLLETDWQSMRAKIRIGSNWYVMSILIIRHMTPRQFSFRHTPVYLQ